MPDPQIAPPKGPRIIAPTATGTVRNVIDNPSVRKYPSGVNAITKIMVTISASSTRYRVRDACVFVHSFFFSPLLSDETAYHHKIQLYVPCLSAHKIIEYWE